MPGPGNRSRAHLTVIGQQPNTLGRAGKWDPDFCEAVVSLARSGKFPEEWAVELGVTFGTLKNWSKRYPEFQEALELARLNLATYWSRYLRDNLTNPRLRTTLFLEMLRTRFPEYWGDNAMDIWEELGLREPENRKLTPEEQARRMSTEELRARLDEARRQREELERSTTRPS